MNTIGQVEVVSKQRKYKVDEVALERFAARALAAALKFAAQKQTGVVIGFVSPRRMRELNREFRGADKVTDVLSFPVEAADEAAGFQILGNDMLGDIIICPQQAAKQAREHNMSFETEIKQLILHGILHLCGYDHEQDDGAMNRLELTLRKRLKI